MKTSRLAALRRRSLLQRPDLARPSGVETRRGGAHPTSSLNGGFDYAYGGAATDTPAISPVAGYAPLITPALQVIGLVPNVNTQIAAYLAKNSPGSHTLYTLRAGANDFFDGQTNPTKPADNLKADILTLISKGAKNFLVANLPSLGETPLDRAQGSAARTGPELSSVVLVLLGCAGLLGCGRLPRKIGRTGAFAVVGGLCAACLVGASAPCRAQTSPPLSGTAGDLAAGADAISPVASDASAAPAEPLFRHIKFDETWLSGENQHGLSSV